MPLKAICNVPDTGPLDSLTVMLESAGYEVYVPGFSLLDTLRHNGCVVLGGIPHYRRRFGYDQPFRVRCASADDMKNADLFVDIKGHRNIGAIAKVWPNLRGKVLWYCINGGKPDVTESDGDKIDPACPLLTANQWYGEQGPWSDRAYCCWLPFARIGDYAPSLRDPVDNPLCLVHSIGGWGFGDVAKAVRPLINLRCHGGADAPDGLVQHAAIPKLLQTAACMVHLKSNDAPGYSLYEAMAAACPLVLSRNLLRVSHVESVWREGENCLLFDHDSDDARTPEQLSDAVTGIRLAVDYLQSNPDGNKRLGLAGRETLERIMWSAERDAGSFADWLRRMF
jgi:hypothetical protein